AASSARARGAVEIDESQDRTGETVRVITRIVHDTPANAACVLPADSLHELQTAVDRANAAARDQMR
ncbi:MAG: hypothetical protein L0H83_07335, partial [Salinisphaera sp.]|nr:hypothetical protein [Salinisphaera sp.]